MPSPPPYPLDYAVPPPKPRPFWRTAVEVIVGIGGLSGFVFGCMSIAMATGLWDEPIIPACIVLGILSLLSFAVSVVMARRWCNEG